MVNKKVNPRYWAGEFPRGRVVMVAKICDNVVEFQDFIPFMLLLQSCVKRDLWDCAVCGSTNCAVWTVCSRYSRGTRRSRRSPLSGRTHGSRWTRVAAWTPRTHPPDSPRLPLRTLNKCRKRLNEAVVFDRVACRGRGCGPVRIAHHLTGSEHLIASGGPGGVHHDRDQNHQHQHQRDATNTSCDHLRSADSPCSLECVVFQPACGRHFCLGKNFTSSCLKLQRRETKWSFKCWCAKVNIHNFYAPRFSWFISTVTPHQEDPELNVKENNTWRLCEGTIFFIVQRKVSAHRDATGEYGAEMNRYPHLCSQSEGRGGGDGWEWMHARENERTYNSDATLRLWNVIVHNFESHPTQNGLLLYWRPKFRPITELLSGSACPIYHLEK